MPNVLSPRDLVSRPDNMEETIGFLPIQFDLSFQKPQRQVYSNGTQIVLVHVDLLSFLCAG